MRRRTIWATWTTGAVNITAGAIVRVSLRTLVQAARPGLGEYTITRSIGNVQWFDESNNAPTNQRGEVYAGMITAPAKVTVSEIPAPFTDTEADWMWWRGSTIPRTDRDIPNWLDWQFDIRSQRKQRELERDWSLVMQNTSAVALEVGVNGRTLLKL